MEAWPPTIAAIRPRPAPSFVAATSSVCSQPARLPPSRGSVIRSSEATIWKPKRPLSQSQPLSTSSFSRASTRWMRSSRTVKSTLHWLGQSVQIEPPSSMSQGRARKR